MITIPIKVPQTKCPICEKELIIRSSYSDIWNENSDFIVRLSCENKCCEVRMLIKFKFEIEE